MIEDEEATRDHQEHFGQMEIVALREWDFRFEKIDCFVTEKTNSTSSEPRQFRVRDKPIGRHQFTDFVERVRRRFKAPLGVGIGNSDFASVTLDNEAGFDPDERESPRDIIFFRRLEEKTVTALIKFLKR